MISATTTVNDYNVTYAYAGTVPTGAGELPNSGKPIEEEYGTEVTVEDAPTTPAGYTFSGWTSDVVTPVDGKFNMPAYDVKFIGSFETNGDTVLTIKHYVEALEGDPVDMTIDETDYTLKDSDPDYGQTGSMAKAMPNQYIGFKFDPTTTKANQQDNTVTMSNEGEVEGTILGDGSRELRFFYSRNKYTVTYEYFENCALAGDDRRPDISTWIKTYKYGEKDIPVNDKLSVQGYTFHGWATKDATVTNNKFTMPDNDVVFTGWFNANTDTIYKVEYWLETTNEGEYEHSFEDDYTGAGTTDTIKSITADDLLIKTFVGFEFDPTATRNADNQVSGVDIDPTDAILAGKITSDGNLVFRIYYSRNEYSVFYEYADDETVPVGATALTPPIYNTGIKYKHGAQVYVAPNADAADYVFSGWTTRNAEINDNSFIMPIGDVTFYGSFTLESGIPYKIERYFEVLEGNDADYETINDRKYLKVEGNDIAGIKETQTFNGTATQTITAQKYERVGFTYDLDTTKLKNDTSSGDIIIDTDGKLQGVIHSDKDLVLRVYYKRMTYNVSYAYIGELIPANAVQFLPEGLANVPYGATVKVAPDIDTTENVPGYTFTGWTTPKGAVGIDADRFTMPNQDVVLQGWFSANTNTKYTIRHIGQDINSNDYTTKLADDEIRYGTTGAKAAAETKKFVGYIYNNVMTAEKGEIGKPIAGDGSTVVTLYYSRNSYEVDYEYIGIVPADAPKTDVAYPTVSYPFGAAVTIGADPKVKGYDFDGWKTDTNPLVNVGANDPSFTMPDGPVQLKGQFIPLVVEYKVEHYIEKRSDEYQDIEDKYRLHTTTSHTDAVTDSIVTAMCIDITGYTYNQDVTESKIPEGSGITAVENNGIKSLTATVKGDGSLVFKLYYDRYPIYKVEYAFAGNVPTGATKPETENYIEGEEVTLKAPTNVPAGYDFSGWTSYGGYVKNGEPSTFSMPARNVHLTGYFTPQKTSYTIKHYLQIVGGDTPEHYATDNYKLDDTQTIYSVVVDQTGVANPKTTYTGYTFDRKISKTTGRVLPGGALELNLYYNKIKYNVHYEYSRIPRGISQEQIASMNNSLTPDTRYYADQNVEVAPSPEIPAGYTFGGWYSNMEESAVVTADSFTMPSKDVTLMARLIPNIDTEYKVEHYIGKGDNVANYRLHQEESFTGTTDSIVTATPIPIDGYDYYDAHPATVKEGIIKGFANEADMLVLKLFYEKEQSSGGGGGGSSYGNLEIKKIVYAPEDFDASSMEYSFDIYFGTTQRGTKYKTVKVKANSSVSISMPVGTFYIVEDGGDVTGYTLKSVCSSEENVIHISTNNTTEVSFENIYTSKEEMLEKNDHFAYIIGYPDGNVRPNAGITRAEVATIFFRMMTDDARAIYRKTSNSFKDVSESDWHNIAISTLQSAKILDGYLDGTFRPDEPITRAELSKIAASFYKAQLDETVKFSDIDGHWAEDFIKSAQGYGFIDGYPDGTFKPDQAITRAETMKIVNRSLERAPHNDYLLDDMIKWPDNANKNEWYYADVQEATNSHDYEKNANYEVWTKLIPVRDWKALEITK